MTKRTHLVLWLALALLLGAVAAQAETLPFSAEVGYRWFTIKGNQDLYRSQINERSGFLIHSMTVTADSEAGLVDQFRLDVSDMGASPTGAFRIEAGKAGLYRLRMGYRQSDEFSAVPWIANPFLGQGVYPGQHTYDRQRRIFDADLELIPGRAITPILGYSFNRYSGPGTTTYDLGGDEFQLDSNLHDRDNEFRAGAVFNTNYLYGQVLQGWRNAKTTDTLVLNPASGAGNNPNALLGQPITATGITRNDSTKVKTPFTNVYLGTNWSNVRVVADYVRFAADSDGSETETSAGNFVSFPLASFFQGTSEQLTSKSKNTTWRGGARTEITVAPAVDLLAGYSREHRSTDGSALINNLFLQALPFGGSTIRKDVATVLEAQSSIDRNDETLHVGVAARAFGPLSLRAEFRQLRQDYDVAPDLEEIVVPGNQGGNYKRDVKTWDTNAQFTHNAFTLGAAWRRDKADQPVFRTDFISRDRLRGRLSWHTPGNMFATGITAEKIDQSNDQTGIAFDNTIRQYSGDFEFAPITMLRLRASVSQFNSDSSMQFRHPENFVLDTSLHAERGKTREGGFNFAFKRVNLDAAASHFENKGTFPFDINRVRVRATLDLMAKTGIAAEWSRDKFDQTGGASYGFYDAKRYGLFLRYTP